MKYSRKRREHIQKLAEMKKKNLAVKKTKKIRKAIKKLKSKPIREIERIVNKKQMSLKCTHYLVGSSGFLRFYRDQYDLNRSHGSLRSGLNKKVGTIGEHAFATTTNHFIYQPFRIYNRIPFLCATPDFILLRPSLVLIEIKTTENIETCKRLFEKTPSEYLLQILVSMEIFSLTNAELFVYFYEGESKFRNCYGYRKWVTLYGRVKIVKKVKLFTDEIVSKLIKKYVVFLKEFMGTQRVKMLRNDEEEIEILLLKCFSTHKTLKVTNKNIRNITSEKQTFILSDFCKKKARFDPDDEMYGTKSRKEYENNRYSDVTKNLKLRFIQKKKSVPKEKTIEMNETLINELLKTEGFLYND